MASLPIDSSRRIPVPPEFEAVFSHFYSAANDTAEPVQKILVPSFRTIMVFSFGAAVSFSAGQEQVLIPKVMVLGPLKQSLAYRLEPGAAILVANFTGDAFYRLFRKAVTNAVHPDSLLAENCFTELWRQLRELPGDEERVGFILGFCRPYLKEEDYFVTTVNHLDKTMPFLNPVKIMAVTTGQTERNVQLKYKRQTGYSIRELIRYRRFMAAMAWLGDKMVPGARIDWLALLEDCHYYDQSQLIHDFQQYLGMSPLQYLKLQQEVCCS